jgi:hypothetical protein
LFKDAVGSFNNADYIINADKKTEIDETVFMKILE